jgi:hypothetical protein
MYGGGVDLTYWGFPCLPRKGFPVTVSGKAFDTGLVMLWLGDDMISSQDRLGIEVSISEFSTQRNAY